jgi:hypothetical protein
MRRRPTETLLCMEPDSTPETQDMGSRLVEAIEASPGHLEKGWQSALVTKERLMIRPQSIAAVSNAVETVG